MQTTSVLEARIIDLTAEQLIKALRSVIDQGKAEIFEYIESRLNGEVKAQQEQQPAYGIKGIAEVLHCSQAKAQRMKSEGLLEGGYQQIGNSIIVTDRELLLQIASQAKQAKTDRRKARRGHRVNYSIINQ